MTGKEQLEVWPEVRVCRQQLIPVGLTPLLECLDKSQKDMFRRCSRSLSAMSSWFMARLPRITQQLAQPLEPAKEQTDSRRACAAELRGHVGHRQPFQVVQLHDPPLVFRQLGHAWGAAADPRRAQPLRSAMSGRPRAGPPAATPIARVPPPAIVRDQGHAPGYHIAGPWSPGHSPGWPAATPATRLRSHREIEHAARGREGSLAERHRRRRPSHGAGDLARAARAAGGSYGNPRLASSCREYHIA